MIVVVDYGVGNLGSILNMLRKAGAEAIRGSEPGMIEEASKLVLPGVGAFDSCIRKFEDSGLRSAVMAHVAADKPLLGICVGMQMLGRSSEEGTCPGLGLIESETVRFRSEDFADRLKVPHMGWGDVRVAKTGPLLDPSKPHRFYFLHSFHMVCDDRADVLAEAEHGYPFTCAISRGNVFGVQFHPEKSHRFGLELMRRFGEF